MDWRKALLVQETSNTVKVHSSEDGVMLRSPLACVSAPQSSAGISFKLILHDDHFQAGRVEGLRLPGREY